jgi:hypothetical protein
MNINRVQPRMYRITKNIEDPAFLRNYKDSYP